MEYIKRKKVEKVLSTARTFKNLKGTGVEYVDEMKKENLSIEKDRIVR